MEMKNFNSTAIFRAGYDASQQLLVLCFTSNPQMEYDYPGVPAHIWQGLVQSHSKGQYYNAYIRDAYGLARLEKRSHRRWP